MSVAMWNCHSWPVDVSSIGQSQFIHKVWCSGIQCIYSQFTGGSNGQSRVICHIRCSGIQGIYSWFTWGGPLTTVGSSAKIGVALFKASILDSVVGPSAKVGSSANFGVLVFKVSLLYSWGPISQSKFICQFWCTGIQGISAVFPQRVHLPRLALTTILHITPGKYEPS